MWRINLILTCILLIQESEGKIDVCDIATLLIENGVPDKFLEDWVCIVYNTSEGIVNKLHMDIVGMGSYGIFQINDTWCNNVNPHKSPCKVTCLGLARATMPEQVLCAANVYRTQGFTAWYAWKLHCRGVGLRRPNLTQCTATATDANWK